MPIQINEVEVVQPPPPPPPPPAAPRAAAEPETDLAARLDVWLGERARLSHRLRAD
ncbi:hypothetical protein BJY21_003238 [Kineosphaera limosa]|uniref:Uncharacterized protein n=1 Tax=Kineosphaera limosa NBRC 100340 TaxID=1184609 RepID=K6W836_9MICO|nr:hypothetical protein [Kineosphaera limosa]NYE02054.1 hypothetical protein [Kineosphaera limosa]GAB95340.1 hypothetical protein KILIM_018_00900 [Kineosphaera limosa NBRC 100340]